MDIAVFNSAQLPTVMRVLRTAMHPAGPLDEREQRFLRTYAQIVGYDAGTDRLDAIKPSEVEIEGAHQRKRLVQLAAVAVLLRDPLRPLSVAYVDWLAKHLGVSDRVVELLNALEKGRTFKVRWLAMRRGLHALLAEARRREGTAGVLRFIGALFFGRAANPDRLRDYRRLGLLPGGTLGRTYWEHMTANDFRFPGESKGIPATVAYHDVVHVLASHDTTPLGEIQQASFQAGNRREDGFFFLQFALLQFHHGIRLTPVSPAYTGFFDPEKVLWAIHRGAQCTVDVTHQWDFWPLMRLPIDEARARCGILAPLAAGA